MSAGTPAQRPGAMPPQDLKSFSRRTPLDGHAVRSRGWRRLLVFAATLALCSYAIGEMWMVFRAGSVAWPEYVVLLLFAATFCWIALACVTGVAGFCVRMFGTRPAPLTQPLTSRTAILMPTYNEDPARLFAAVEAMARGIAAGGEGHSFDWFFISDTTDPDILLQEEEALLALRRRLGAQYRVYYRRRRENRARKAGNVADFCRRWGRHYDHLLVLDADSLIEAETLIQLARRMEAAPDTGLIQTIPTLIRGNTPMARLQQFAARIYGPVVGTGLAWWADRDGNFWGHNAILRTRAFMDCAGLPELRGRPPFGGHVLSHDFVEAALLRRAGWAVTIAWDLDGSYEESPPSLIDMAVRDRRWCQGNLQHARILPTRGLSWVSRMHLLTGIMSYLSSPLWLLLVLSGFALTLQAHFIPPDYFANGSTLFPAWPVLDAERALRLFSTTMLVLFTPKILGFASSLLEARSRRGSGGTLGLAKSFVLELLLSALIAPVMMLIHCGAVVSVLLGSDGGWNPQRREDGSLPWRDVWRRHRLHMAVGIALGGAAWLISWQLLAWLSPVIVSLVLAVPLSYCTASPTLGRLLRRGGWLCTPEEAAAPAIEQALARVQPLYRDIVAAAPRPHHLAGNLPLARRRLALIDPVPPRQPGSPGPREAVVIAKLGEARSAAEALSFMDRGETAWLLSSPELYGRLVAMLERESLPTEVTAARA
ncbi:glucans biosynthesis glucosyltransferase MdoH [Microbulbifer sp. SAOS-129_SWC]|uniref:glucans biosynthesis glucosyltransferase MdoH n=1 Tax=Microbulbifer sp. SAOS-129_SWC TaxID=3145235 RepID=UPI0032168ECE